MFAAGIRDHPRLMGYPDPRRSAFAVVSRGIAGLTEVSFELEPSRRRAGGGAELVRDALSAIPSGQLAVAAVAPGNAASVRALLAAGFVPLGSIQLFRCAGHPHPLSAAGWVPLPQCNTGGVEPSEVGERLFRSSCGAAGALAVVGIEQPLA